MTLEQSINMNRKNLKLSVLIAIAAILLTPLISACGSGGEPQKLTLPVIVAGKSMEPETIEVRQGDTVTLQIKSEESGEFHVHGYDVETEAHAGEVTDLNFVADATGRFKITFHETGHGEKGDQGKDTDEKEHDDGDDHDDDDQEDEEEGDEEESEIEIGFLEVLPR